MTHQVYKDGVAYGEGQDHAWQCVAIILSKGWNMPVERYGVCWVKGIEIRETQNVVGPSAIQTREVSDAGI